MSGKTFRFSLETVLEVKNHEVDRLEKKLGAALQRRQKKQKVLEQLQEPIEFGGGQSSARHRVAAQLRQRDRYRQERQHRITAENQKLSALNEEVSKLRTKLRDKRKDQKGFEQVKEKEKKKFDLEVKRREARELDEQAIFRHHQAKTSL